MWLSLEGPQHTMQISPLRQVQSLTYEAKKMIKKKKRKKKVLLRQPYSAINGIHLPLSV